MGRKLRLEIFQWRFIRAEKIRSLYFCQEYIDETGKITSVYWEQKMLLSNQIVVLKLSKKSIKPLIKSGNKVVVLHNKADIEIMKRVL